MKKISTILFLSLTAAGFAQSTGWDTKPMVIDPSSNSTLGTKNVRSLNFVSADTTRVVVDSVGNLKITKLALDADAPSPDALRFAYVDKWGNISARQNTGPSISCGAGTSPWLLGGNTINTGIANTNLIGPCNSGFVLQGNAVKTVFLSNGKLGIGQDNGTPTAIVDISDPSLASGQREHLRIYGDATGKIEATNNMNLFYSGTFDINQGSTNMFHMDNGTGDVTMAGSASISGNSSIGGSSSITGNSAVGGNSSVNGNASVSGKLGIGVGAPSVKLDIVDASNAKIHLYNNNSTPGVAEIWTYNNANSYAFRIDASGMGRISNDITNGPTNLLSFTKSSVAGAQVWVGDIKPTASAYTDFNFAVAGKVVAKSVYVTLNCTWADYVFDKNYKLPKLSDVESYYKANKHLPEVPSAKEVEEKGIDVGEMNTLLLKKVEELTLYMVEQQKITNALKKEFADLKEQSK